jgi:hypothetical protein
MDKEKKCNNKEDKKMQQILEREIDDIKLSMKKLSSKIPIIGGPKGKIRLNPEDENHKGWYEDDDREK